MGGLVEGALALARWGIPVISLRPGTKVPIHARWPNLGMLDEAAIHTEWRINPGANIGVLCGPDAFDGAGLAILDVDQPDGPASLERLEELHGPLPVTPIVDTPSGGTHWYYAGRAPSWNPAPGLEVRSAGRQCAAPPSVVNGTRYEWWLMHGFGDPVEPLPEWLATPPRARIGSPEPRASRAAHGGLCDPVLDVPPPVYFKVLCGLEPDRHGFVSCLLHEDWEPSCKVYDTAERGWYCYGGGCEKGGDVVTLAALLAGLTPPLRGYEFIACLDYLRGRLL